MSDTVLAGFSALFGAPAAQAADERVDVGQLSLRPANVRGAGFSAQQQAYLLGFVIATTGVQAA